VIRVIAPLPLDPSAGTVELSRDEIHHLRVRRVQAGEEVVVLDGAGHVGSGFLHRDGSRVWVACSRVNTVAQPPELRVLAGAGDRDRFAALAEKCVELGVTDLVPIVTQRSENVATRLKDSHLPRLRRTALESLKQSGGAWGLTIHPITTLDQAISLLPAGLRWLADPAGSDAVPPDPGHPVAILVGPEGGLTDSERKRCQAADFVLICLGPRILRFETAAIAAAVLAGYRRKETYG